MAFLLPALSGVATAVAGGLAQKAVSKIAGNEAGQTANAAVQTAAPAIIQNAGLRLPNVMR